MKYPKDQGYQEFEFRPGVKFPKFKGMHRMGDPASIPVNQFHYLENVRIVGGEIDSRGGQGRYIDHSESGCMEGIFPPEFQFADDEAGSIVLNGFSTGVLNITTLTANYRLGSEYDLSNNLIGLFVIDVGGGFQSQAYFGCREGPINSDSEYGATIRQYKGLNATPAIVSTFPSSVIQVTGMTVLGSVLYLGVINADDLGEVWVWDGVTNSVPTLSDSPEIAGPVRITATTGGEIIACYGAVVRKRTVGGVWSTQALPGGLTTFNGRSFCIFGGKLWIGGGEGSSFSGSGDALLLSYTSPNLTLEHTVTDGVSIGALGAFNSLLYYGIHASGAANGDLGKTDGAIYTDLEHDFNTEYAVHLPAFTGGSVGALTVFQSIFQRGANLCVVTTPYNVDTAEKATFICESVGVDTTLFTTTLFDDVLPGPLYGLDTEHKSFSITGLVLT